METTTGNPSFYEVLSFLVMKLEIGNYVSACVSNHDQKLVLCSSEYPLSNNFCFLRVHTGMHRETLEQFIQELMDKGCSLGQIHNAKIAK